MTAERAASSSHVILVGGDRCTASWEALAADLLLLALDRLAAQGLAPARSEVSVTLVDDEQIRDLNREYRGLDAPTDVLSFSLLEGGGVDPREFPAEVAAPIGDIVISMPRMQEQAVEYGHSERREFGYLLIHGLLHLLGHDHLEPDDALRMRAAEEDLLSAAGLTRDGVGDGNGLE